MDGEREGGRIDESEDLLLVQRKLQVWRAGWQRGEEGEGAVWTLTCTQPLCA